MADSAEATFAQRLASNEAKDRHRALKKLRKYIGARASQTGFTRDELRKLWKGLHYSMWMQDKPLLQEELAARMSQLLLAFSDPSAALNFAAAFFSTQGNEWHRLDQWRMDKFMMLVREMVRGTLAVLGGAGWPAGLVAAMAGALEAEVLSPGLERVADGLRLHLADLFLTELAAAPAATQLQGDQIVALLQPFINYISKSDRMGIVDKISEKIFGAIAEEVQGGGKRVEEEEEEEEEEESPRLQYDVKAIADALLARGREKSCPQRNRARLYKVVRKLNVLIPEDATVAAEETPKTGKKRKEGSEGESMKKAKKRKEDEQEGKISKTKKKLEEDEEKQDTSKKAKKGKGRKGEGRINGKREREDGEKGEEGVDRNGESKEEGGKKPVTKKGKKGKHAQKLK